LARSLQGFHPKHQQSSATQRSATPAKSPAGNSFPAGFFRLLKKELSAMTANRTPAEALPLQVAAERLGTTPLNVLMHIKRQLLTAEERDGQWYVDAASLQALQASQGTTAKSLCRSQCAASGGCKSCG
jgi:hypothetical protein